MTTEKENEQKFAYMIFSLMESGKTRIGSAYRHNKGNGLNIVVNGTRYVAFPPKSKPEKEEGA